MKQAVMVGLAMLLSGEAMASPVRAVGSCTRGSVWEMEAVRDGGRVEVELEVESFRRGQQWTVELRQNNNAPVRFTRTTRGSDGYWWVERSFANAPGNDVFVGFARNTVTGETCSGRLEWTR
jgi:hypothetical protein